MSSVIKFKGLGKLEKKTKKLLEEKINDSRLKKECAEYIVKNIKGSARNMGKDINGGKYAPLAPSTVKQRQKSKKAKHTAYSPKRSNVTHTGETIDAITYKVSNKKPLISVIAEGTHSSGVPYKDILTYLHFGTDKMPARPIFGWSEKMVKVIKNKFKAHLRRSLSRKK